MQRVVLAMVVALGWMGCEDPQDPVCEEAVTCWQGCEAISSDCNKNCPSGTSTTRPSGCIDVTDDSSSGQDTSDSDTEPGPVLCEGNFECTIPGSLDCAEIGACSIDLDEGGCTACQGVACGTVSQCDTLFPCVDGAIVVQGCCLDSDCVGVAPFCGRYIGTNNVCVLHDDI